MITSIKKKSKVLALCLSAALSLNAFGLSALAGDVQSADNKYKITNPYENVDWYSTHQFKADFHAHSTNSDGGNTRSDMIEDHYAKNFDILTMTDHNFTTTAWDELGYGGNPGLSNPGKGALESGRKAEIEAGIGRGGKGMIGLDNTNEQSNTDHINTFFADFNNPSGSTRESIIATAEALGGISHLNHPGRYTGGSSSNDVTSIAAANNSANIKKYVDLFSAYPSLIGMEIINKIDNESKSDRILWDNILKEMMPNGRFVWGFSNDDTHSLNATGYAWNVMLMPALNQAETRKAMETGAFYAVSRVSRLDGINRYYPAGGEVRGDGAAATLYLLNQPTPGIQNIAVDNAAGSISITGNFYDIIEWIADGEVIATGSTINLNDYQGQINSYVRAQLKSDTGIAFTQPFGVEMAAASAVYLVDATPSASVKKLNGNKNDLTITVTENFSDGSVNKTTATFSINNNAADLYTVGEYTVYVDTKGNDQIRQCYIVN